MRVILAMLRASWLTTASFRLGLVFSLVGLVVGLVPVFYVARALQGLMGEKIAAEGGQYFAFVVIGTIALRVVMTSLNALPGSIAGAIGGGMLDAVFSTPTSPVVSVAGLTSYQFADTFVRGLLTLLIAYALGARVAWHNGLWGLVLLAVIGVSYLPFAVLSSAMIVAFRTDGPLRPGLVVLTTVLGGAYYPTTVLPGWVASVANLVPLTYGLRALRMVVLDGRPITSVWLDVTILLGATAVLGFLAAGALRAAFRYARRTGTLAQY